MASATPEVTGSAALLVDFDWVDYRTEDYNNSCTYGSPSPYLKVYPDFKSSNAYSNRDTGEVLVLCSTNKYDHNGKTGGWN